MADTDVDHKVGESPTIPPTGGGGQPPTLPGKDRQRGKGWGPPRIAAAAAVVIVGGTIGALIGAHFAQPPKLTMADFMGLSPLPHTRPASFTAQGRATPGPGLVDQNGRRIHLSQFRGKAVVLEFMDPLCVDICPLLSQEIVLANRDLGPKAKDVVFLAVNVNSAHNSVAAVRAFTEEHGLASLPNWHFLTGPVQALQPVWANYGIDVQISPTTGAVVHSDQMYFIGPKGYERYEAAPNATILPNGTAVLPPASLARWGRGIANYAGSLVP